MAVGLQKPVRRALLTHLKADSDVLDLVPAASINPDGEPVWPFIALRSPVTQPLRASCVRGGNVAWDIHAFAGKRLNVSGQVAETAEDHAGSIGAAIEASLQDNRLVLENGGEARIRMSDIRLLPDGDPDHYHWFAQVNARVLAE
jgi:hypothetical protein